jgi:hypothetical protein
VQGLGSTHPTELLATRAVLGSVATTDCARLRVPAMNGANRAPCRGTERRCGICGISCVRRRCEDTCEVLRAASCAARRGNNLPRCGAAWAQQSLIPRRAN